MQNDYFNHDVPLARQTVARAESLNDIFHNVQAGFAKIPDVAEVKDGRIVYGTDSGSVNAYAVTMPHSRTQLVDGMQSYFRALHANTGPSNLNLDGLGAVALIRLDGQDSGGYSRKRFCGMSLSWAKQQMGFNQP